MERRTPWAWTLPLAALLLGPVAVAANDDEAASQPRGRLPRSAAPGNEDRLAALDRLEERARQQHDRKVSRVMERGKK